MKRSFTLSVFLLLLLSHSFAGPTPPASNDRDFVPLGHNGGYYMVSSDSGKMGAFGFGASSGRGTDDPGRQPV